MKKFLVLISLTLVLAFPGQSQASSAQSVVETQVEGEAEVYQYVETTVDGETVIKESSQPGKLELKMEKTGEGKPTVSFIEEPQEEITPPMTGKPATPPETPTVSFVSKIIEFIERLLSNLTSFFK